MPGRAPVRGLLRYPPVPEIRAFRALRFDPEVVGDLTDVVTPPYDVISPAQQQAFARRHPRNVVRLDLPLDEPGDEPDARYRRAARDFVAWRSEGILRKDRRACVYPYEQTYRVPGTAIERTQRGFFARLRLVPFGSEGGVLPHERTLSAPKEDRYKLLRATGANFSPVVVLHRDTPDGITRRVLRAMAAAPATSEVVDGDGVRHRMWAVPEEEGLLDVEGAGPQAVQALLQAASAGPLTIADGHHRYETALRYHDERHRDRSLCVEATPFDYILALFLSADDPLAILPTHRVVRGGPRGEDLLAAAERLFDVEPVSSPEALRAAFAAPDALRDGTLVDARGGASPGMAPTDARTTARGQDDAAGPRFGCWTGGRGAILRTRRAALEPLLPADASETLRWLDVGVLAVALEQLCGVSPTDTAAGGRLVYTKDAGEAIEFVERGEGDAAFLLDPTPVEVVLRVAEAGEFMPQKSTYFYPKPVTGLLLNPHEW